MHDRTVPLPKFWPGDRVEVRYEINGSPQWVPAEVVDAMYRISTKGVSYFVVVQMPRDNFWISEPIIRAAVESE